MSKFDFDKKTNNDQQKIDVYQVTGHGLPRAMSFFISSMLSGDKPVYLDFRAAFEKAKEILEDK